MTTLIPRASRSGETLLLDADATNTFLANPGKDQIRAFGGSDGGASERLRPSVGFA